jgi:hypothetical protein
MKTTSVMYGKASRHYRNIKREYLKYKINYLQSSSKNKNIRELYRGITEFKKGYKPTTNMVKDKRGDLLADPNKILHRWKNSFCQLLNVQGVDGVRQTEIQTEEPSVPGPSTSEVEVDTRKLRRYKSKESDQIPGRREHCLLTSTNL